MSSEWPHHNDDDDYDEDEDDDGDANDDVPNIRVSSEWPDDWGCGHYGFLLIVLPLLLSLVHHHSQNHH